MCLHIFIYYTITICVSPHQMIILAPEVESWNHLETWRVSTENGEIRIGPFGLRETVDCFVALLLGGGFFLGGQGVCFFGGVLGWGPNKNAGPMLKNRLLKA